MVRYILKHIWVSIRSYLDGHHILWSSIFKDDKWLRKMIQMRRNPSLFDPELDGHHILWSSIFKNDKWLQKMIQMKGNPFLFGPELDKIGLLRQHKKPIYMTIHCGDKTTDPDYDFRLFRKSLQQHKYNESTKEITVCKDIILNVSEIECPEDPLQLDNEWLVRLFSKHNSRAISQYSFYDSNKVSTLLPSHVIAVGGPPYDAEILKYGYAITIPCGKDTRHVFFQALHEQDAVEFDLDNSGRVLWMKVRQ